MFKEIGRVVELLKYPQSIILGLDKVAHINSDDLTLTITSEECAELIQSITKVKRYGFHDKYEEKLQEEYDALYEGHDKLSHEWALVKKQYRELSCKYDDLIKKYSELLKDSNRNDNELFQRTY